MKWLREKGKCEFNCPCGGTVTLAEPKERIHFRSKVEAVEHADRQRDFDAFVVSAKGETSTQSFQDWAGATLRLISDVRWQISKGAVNEAIHEVRRAHFARSRRLIGQFQGREIKTIGDSFMAAFKSAGAALDYLRVPAIKGDLRRKAQLGP